MCLELIFPFRLQLSPDLLFVTIFSLCLAGRAHLLGMWDATFKFFFTTLLPRLDVSWTLLSPHHTHTNILTNKCVCPA